MLPRGVKPAAADAGEGDGDPDVVEAPLHWNFITAQAISKVGLQIQRELLEERTISYLIEWCETPDIRSTGVAYTDTSVLYDTGNCNVKLAHKSPDHNLYLMVPRPLLDPVLDFARIELEEFYSQTFWANVEVFRCFQSAIALAMRGENIDRCFIGVSPGGVGQSLYSGHLAGMYDKLHTFFDPNIWYHDDELRKQVDQFIGCVILTGQEAPETNRRMREDLYKKTMSADGACWNVYRLTKYPTSTFNTGD
jgi:hypothetical protein